MEDGVNLGISRKTDAWVAWMVEVFQAAQAACKGLVAFVVAGQTKNYRWSAGPALLMAELHRAGMNLRNPPIFHRVGIPGSGGPDWLRNDYEWIVCTSKPGKLPWSDNTAMGHPPKWAPGGEMSYRTLDGERVNAKTKTMGELMHARGGTRRAADGTREKMGQRESGKRERSGVRHKQFHQPNGEQEDQQYEPPALANPGNVIRLNVWRRPKWAATSSASANEAPFPEKLAEFFVLSFCPPGGTVADVFSGSGTTAAVAKRHGRNFLGCDLRQSQVDLALRRCADETPLMFV